MFGDLLLYKDDQGNVIPEPIDDIMQGVEIVGCFFGGSWQQHSLDFTPVLASWYTAARLAGIPLEVIYISNDESQTAFSDYYVYSMPFAAVPFTNKSMRLSLRQQLNITEIPSLLFLNRRGDVLGVNGTTNGSDIVMQDRNAVELLKACRSRYKHVSITVSVHGSNYSLCFLCFFSFCLYSLMFIF